MNIYHVRHGSILPLGKQGENMARKIQFDISRWIGTFGPGTVQLLHQRSGDDAPYPVAVEKDGTQAIWTVTNADTAAAGTGRAELQYYVGDALAKSETWMTKVLPSLGDASETPPEAQQGWVDQVLQAGTVATEAAEKAANAAVRQPIVGDNQNWWTWNIAAGAYEDTGIYAAGHSPYIGNNGNWWIGAEDTGVAATGPQGPQGIQGIQGQAGPAGSDGQDGITPTIGDNGNWYLGDTDTGKPSRGETGQAGADGRDGADGQPGADGKSAYQYAVEGGYTGTEAEFAAKLAEQMPDRLPNPNALTFSGSVTGSYDGSAQLSVEIPSGGEGLTVTNTAAVGQTVKITAVDENGQPTEWEAVDMASGGGYGEIVTADETILASGTIATGTVKDTYIDTGVTLAELRNWKYWTVEVKSSGQTTYWGVGFNRKRICRVQHSNIKFQIEWIDSAKTVARVFYASGTGYEYGIDDILYNVINSSQPAAHKQGAYAKVAETDDSVLNINMFNDLTVDALWRVKGVLRYGD